MPVESVGGNVANGGVQVEARKGGLQWRVWLVLGVLDDG
jgi:hypothetical protein